MSSEWMKVMLGEIARKKAEASEAQAELERRLREQDSPPPADSATLCATAGGAKSPGGLPPQ